MTTTLTTATHYRLPDGRIVRIDASAARGAFIVSFTLANGTIVDAVRVEKLFSEGAKKTLTSRR